MRGFYAVFVGFNPGTASANAGHHYAGRNNHFWPLLYESQLVSQRLSSDDDWRLPEFRFGLTNIVERTTKNSSQLTKDEMAAGARRLCRKLKRFRPRIVCFNGKMIYEAFVREIFKENNPSLVYGLQPYVLFSEEREENDKSRIRLFVMPSTSARCSQFPRAGDKLAFFQRLKVVRDRLFSSLDSAVANGK